MEPITTDLLSLLTPICPTVTLVGCWRAILNFLGAPLGLRGRQLATTPSLPCELVTRTIGYQNIEASYAE